MDVTPALPIVNPRLITVSTYYDLLRSPRARANPNPAREDAEIHAAPVMERTDTTESPQQKGLHPRPVQSVPSRHRRALSRTRRSVRLSARQDQTRTQDYPDMGESDGYNVGGKTVH
jgi:hypothetical protein